MVNNKRNWSKQYEIIYNIFCKKNHSNDNKPTIRGFCDLLGISLGKRQKWEAGQWPNADDLLVLHKKMGFSYEWLVTGEGDLFDTPQQQTALTPPEPQIDVRELLARLEAVEKKLEIAGEEGDKPPYADTQAGHVARGVQQDGI